MPRCALRPELRRGRLGDPGTADRGRLFLPPAIYASSLPAFKVDGGAGPFDSWVESTARPPYPLGWSTLVTVRQTADCFLNGQKPDGGLYAGQVNNESMLSIVPISDLVAPDGR